MLLVTERNFIEHIDYRKCFLYTKIIEELAFLCRTKQNTRKFLEDVVQ